MTNTTTHFFEKVYTIARQIPYGKVTTYGAIAKALGTARSASRGGPVRRHRHRHRSVHVLEHER
jgi:methylated-DNA-protein-cysteine methyltransferase-like protein